MYMIKHMEHNLAFKEYIKLNKILSKDKYEKILGRKLTTNLGQDDQVLMEHSSVTRI